ncbi:hypothetical protein SAMN05428944_7676 [Streptomyces sp. 1222.5]|nr:hypothetical protein BX260_0408 [Streptomyces sp. 5112.2]SEC11165.1 hypothetical protein SAMN05216532_0503 [Streptomyces sp. 2231.1]SED43793.1 hypothetical protein SAMN05428944_7676 [Streptomyces sp. 1222.5]
MMENAQGQVVASQVTEGTWGMPLIVLIPVAALRIFTGLSTPWLVCAWILWGLAALLTLVGWVHVVRYGPRNARGWSACVPLHCALLWLGGQLILAG